MTAHDTSGSVLTVILCCEEVCTLSALLPTVLVVQVMACHHCFSQPQALAGNGKTVSESLSVLVTKFSASEDLFLPAEEGFSVGYTNKESFLPCSATQLIVCSSSPHENEELSSSPHKPVSDSEDDIDSVA
jgi:hypothetical protein